MKHTIALTPGKSYDIKITIDGSRGRLPTQGDIAYLRKEIYSMIEGMDSKAISQIEIEIPDDLSFELLELPQEWVVKNLTVTYNPKPAWWSE